MAFAALIFGSSRRWMPSHLSRPRLRWFDRKALSMAHSEAVWLENLASSPYKVQRESEKTTKLKRIALRSLFNQSNLNFWWLDCQESCSLAALQKYDSKCDLKNPMCLSIPLKYLSKGSETWTLETHQSNLLLQSHRDTKQTSPQWKEVPMQNLRSSFQSTSATASKTSTKICVLWSRSDLDLGLYSLFLALTLWLWSYQLLLFQSSCPLHLHGNSLKSWSSKKCREILHLNPNFHHTSSHWWPFGLVGKS